MMQRIAGYQEDSEGHWVAELECGHNQHVRHEPPWMHREWATTEQGRESMLGFELQCIKCDENAPRDIDSRPQSQPKPMNANGV